MTTKTEVSLQISDLIFSCLTPRVKACIHLENFIFVSKCNDFSPCLTEESLAHPTVNVINALAEGVNGAIIIWR